MKKSYISIQGLFPKLYKKIPGLIKGTYYAVTGNTGTGKTKFTKFLFVQHAYKYCKENDIPLHILYFALEESKEKFWITMLCDLLYQRYNVTITYYQYMGYHEGVTDQIRQYIKEVSPIIEDMKKYIHVFDMVSNPSGIKLTIERFMSNLGERIDGVIDEDEWGNKFKSFDFKYHNEKTHVLVVIDHVSLISPEKNQFTDCTTTHLAMSKWSEYVVKFICKKYQCIVCNVHQQQSSADNTENMKLDNLQPALSKFGDNLLIGRDYMVVFGIFNPARYKLTQKTYGGFNIEEMNGSFRELSVLKHRDGEDNIRVAMQFDGRINFYK